MLGLATGSLTALVALGVVLVYRASGILNFAAAALGAVGAFVCYSLRDDHGVPGWAALGAGLLVGTLLGVGTYLAMALLRQSSLLTRLVATLGLFSAAQGFMVVVWGDDIRQPAPLLPHEQVTLWGDVRVGEDRLLLLGLALVLVTVLGLAYSRTLFGLASSAVAEKRRVAAGFGWSVSSIEVTNFAIAGFLSALAATLIAPIVTLTPAVLSVAILPALAAALVGRFSSFGATLAASLVIGVLQSELTLFQPDIARWLDVSGSSLTGLPQAVPLAIILLFTIIGGRSRLGRGEQQARLPRPGSGLLSPVPMSAGLGAAILMLVAAPSWADSLIATFSMGIIVMSVVVVSGYAGQLSLCQYALAGFGAWTAARLVVSLGAPFELAFLVAIAATVGIGIVLALPAIRMRGVSLAVATLALALLFESLIFRNSSLTGGFNGLVVDTPSILGIEFDPVRDPQRYAALVLAALVVSAVAASNLRRGRVGRRLLAIRANEQAAASVGISVMETKVYAFAVGAAIASVGGVLLAFRHTNVQFGTFNVFGSILLIQYAVIGGIGWVSGAVVGAAGAPGGLLATGVSRLGGEIDNIVAWLALFTGALGVLLLRTAPDGIAEVWARRVGDRLPRMATTPIRGRQRPSDVPHSRPPSTLDVDNLGVEFGGVRAVNGVTFSVRPGEIVGLIGPNGAGKTTILDAVSGFTTPCAGEIRLDGEPIDRWTPERRARRGVIRSWQGVDLFDDMTVRENLLVACDAQQRNRMLLDLVNPGHQTLTSEAEAVVDDLQLRVHLDDRPASLPQGIRRLVGIARAACARPTILLLDEPAAGLGTVESNELAAAITRLARRGGLPIVVVEHDVPMLHGMCDRIVALDLGQKIAEGTPAEVASDKAVVTSYLGDEGAQEPAVREGAEVTA